MHNNTLDEYKKPLLDDKSLEVTLDIKSAEPNDQLNSESKSFAIFRLGLRKAAQEQPYISILSTYSASEIEELENKFIQKLEDPLVLNPNVPIKRCGSEGLLKDLVTLTLPVAIIFGGIPMGVGLAMTEADDEISKIVSRSLIGFSCFTFLSIVISYCLCCRNKGKQVIETYASYFLKKQILTARTREILSFFANNRTNSHRMPNEVTGLIVRYAMMPSPCANEEV
jgi:hypothetical protein